MNGPGPLYRKVLDDAQAAREGRWRNRSQQRLARQERFLEAPVRTIYVRQGKAVVSWTKP